MTHCDPTKLDLQPDVTSAHGSRRRVAGAGTIGLIGHDLMTSSFAGAIVRGAQDAAGARGAVLLIMATSRSSADEARELETLLHEQVDGILCGSADHAEITVPSAVRAHPVVLVNATSTDRTFSSVTPDELACGWDGTDVLLRAGHRRIALVADAAGGLDSTGREQGFRSRSAAAGLTSAELTVVTASPDAAGGFEAASRLLTGADRPTGILCVNDRIAIGVYRAAAALDLTVPTDVSVVGIGDADDTAQALQPQLTKVLLPHHEMGRWAADHLLERVATGRSQPQAVRIRGHVVERDSVARPAPATPLQHPAAGGPAER